MTGTERKTINKYYPPDFDPRKIPKGKYEPNRQYVIRVMSPFNMRCNTCSEYIYKGKKFNARRETVQDDAYLGLSLFRFYIRCPGCLAEITFKTDLENCDYSQEHGATRLFEAEKLLRDEEARQKKQDDEDKTNPMKMLENRTKMSRFEMDALERIEELKEMNVRQAKPDYESLITEITKDRQAALQRQEEEDEAFVKAIYGRTEDGKVIKRLRDDDEEQPTSSNTFKDQKPVLKPTKMEDTARKKLRLDQKSIISSGIVVKKAVVKKEEPASVEVAKKQTLKLVANYSESSESD